MSVTPTMLWQGWAALAAVMPYSALPLLFILVLFCTPRHVTWRHNAFCIFAYDLSHMGDDGFQSSFICYALVCCGVVSLRFGECSALAENLYMLNSASKNDHLMSTT